MKFRKKIQKLWFWKESVTLHWPGSYAEINFFGHWGNSYISFGINYLTNYSFLWYLNSGKSAYLHSLMQTKWIRGLWSKFSVMRTEIWSGTDSLLHTFFHTSWKATFTEIQHYIKRWTIVFLKRGRFWSLVLCKVNIRGKKYYICSTPKGQFLSDFHVEFFL